VTFNRPIGRLDQRLVIERETATADGAGGYTLGWEPFASVWGRIEAVGGGEHVRAMAREAKVAHRIIIRRLPGVTAEMRIKAGTRVFNIRAVLDSGARQSFLELLCEEGMAT
jgi:SPP1 family predicted phage head-tail adaptor